MLFGNKIKELRDEQGLLQRQLAAFLEIDTPMYSKIERGDRRAKREQVIKLAEYLHQDEKEMLTLWLADKFIDAVEGEQERDLCNDAIIIAQEIIRAQGGLSVAGGCRCLTKDGNTSIEKEGYIPYPLQA